MAKKRASTFLGPNQGLSVIGEHAYAYSGLFAANTDDQTALSFTSGDYYLDGYLQLNGAVDDDNPASTVGTACRVSFNGVGIFILVTGDASLRMSKSPRQKIIIPPWTKVIVILDSDGTQADQFGSIVITGRIYDV